MKEKVRCSWCLKTENYMEYHDREWGVPVHDDQKHFEFCHQFVTCSCGESLYPQQISQHKLVECEARFIICRYCHLLLPAGKLSRTAKDLILGLGLTEHESECGARTFECQKCSKSVQLKGKFTR